MKKRIRVKIYKRAYGKVKDYILQHPDVYDTSYEVAISENILSKSEKRVFIPATKKLMRIFHAAITREMADYFDNV